MFEGKYVLIGISSLNASGCSLFVDTTIDVDFFESDKMSVDRLRFYSER